MRKTPFPDPRPARIHKDLTFKVQGLFPSSVEVKSTNDEGRKYPSAEVGKSKPARLRRQLQFQLWPPSRSLIVCPLLLGVLVLIWQPPSSTAIRQYPAASRSNFPLVSAKHARPRFVPGEVLVRFKKGRAFEALTQISAFQPVATKASDQSSVATESIALTLERLSGSNIVEGLRIARMSTQDTLKAVTAFRARDDVLYAEPNYIIQGELTPNDPRYLSNELYGLNLISTPQAWNTTTGNRNVVVAVADEGIDIGHPDLQANIWTNPSPGSIAGISGDVNGYDFRDHTGTITAEPHATHVAGTIGAVGNNAQGVVGVNWQTSMMSLRFIAADTNSGTQADALAAYAYAKQMRDLWNSSGGSKGANIRVVNASFGGGGYSQAAADAINALGQSGILFVAAAGNDAINTDIHPHYPSNYSLPNVISVAATDANDSLAVFSNFGARSVMIGAPGVSILSTLPGNTYGTLSGTSMSAPHVAGAAALLCSVNSNLTVNQLRALLSFNGDTVASLQGKSLTGRRLNVFKSLQALNENDVTPPGAVTNFQVTSQTGRALTLSWTASGDDGSSGQASLYDLSFTDQQSGAVIPLATVSPAASGSAQSAVVTIPYRHLSGTIKLREFDNVGNEGAPATTSIGIDPVAADPYALTLNQPAELTTGGTGLGLTFDDRYKENYALPFSFPFFGQSFSSVTISTNGNLYFSPPPKRSNGDADDVPSSTADLTASKMIAGMWDDLDLSLSRRADADVYVVQPAANRIVFRWQGVQYGDGTNGAPVNFEIELRSDGAITTRYGAGNTNLFPVVGISNGEADAYIVESLTSEVSPLTLTNAQAAVFSPRSLSSPTPTPTPTPSPTPSPTPTPSRVIQIMLDASGPAPDQLAALSSVTFLRDPFPVSDPLGLFNSLGDSNTRIILFATNLTLNAGETSAVVTVTLTDSSNQVFDVSAEDVRAVPNLDLSQVVFRLPTNVAPGVCSIRLKAHGQISNSGTIRIRI